MSKAILSTLLTMLTTASTALIALLTQEGVTQFSDVPETAYMTVILGAIVAGTTTWKARLAEPPKNRFQKGA